MRIFIRVTKAIGLNYTRVAVMHSTARMAEDVERMRWLSDRDFYYNT